MSVIIQILTLLGIIAAVVGVPWHLRGRFDSLKQDLNRLERGQLQGTKLSNGLLGLVGFVIALLHNRKSLSDEELRTVLARYSEMAQIPEVGGNPLVAEEQTRLNGYLAKARRGDFFSPSEVEDYNSLVLKLQEEKKNDPDVWPLVALGAFLSGLFSASKK